MFGKKISPEERFNECRKKIRGSVRYIEREKRALLRKELEMKNQMKEYSKKNSPESVLMIATNVVKNRAAMYKFNTVQGRLESILNHLVIMKAEKGITETMKDVGALMTQFNKELNINEMNRIVQQFTMQNDISEAKGEMIDEIMNDATETDVEDDAKIEIANVLKDCNVPMTYELQIEMSKQQIPC